MFNKKNWTNPTQNAEGILHDQNNDTDIDDEGIATIEEVTTAVGILRNNKS